jgi:hypothetical protein
MALLSEVLVDDSVINGDKKVNAISSFFMDKASVLSEGMNSKLKTKKLGGL